MQILLNEQESQQYLKDLNKPESYIKIITTDNEFTEPPYQPKPTTKQRMRWGFYLKMLRLGVNHNWSVNHLQEQLTSIPGYISTTNQLKAKLRSIGVAIATDGTLSWKDT